MRKEIREGGREDDPLMRFVTAVAGAVSVYLAVLVGMIVLALLTGCKPKQVTVVEQVTQTEVRHVTEWKTDTLWLEIPSQSAEAIVRDTTSVLETDFALSRASILADGSLYHSLHNKAQKRPQEVQTPIERVDSLVYVTKEVPKEVPAPLTWWQRVRIDAFGWLVALSVLLALPWVVKILRKFR